MGYEQQNKRSQKRHEESTLQRSWAPTRNVRDSLEIHTVISNTRIIKSLNAIQTQVDHHFTTRFNSEIVFRIGSEKQSRERY